MGNKIFKMDDSGFDSKKLNPRTQNMNLNSTRNQKAVHHNEPSTTTQQPQAQQNSDPHEFFDK